MFRFSMREHLLKTGKFSRSAGAFWGFVPQALTSPRHVKRPIRRLMQLTGRKVSAAVTSHGAPFSLQIDQNICNYTDLRGKYGYISTQKRIDRACRGCQ